MNNEDPTGYVVGVDDLAIITVVGLTMLVSTAVAVIAANADTSGMTSVDPTQFVKNKIVSLFIIPAAIVSSSSTAAGKASDFYSQSRSSSKAKSKSVSASGTGVAAKPGIKLKPVFPLNPNFFNPRGCTEVIYKGTGNGKIIKWLNNGKMVFEWNEDFRHGQYYHVAFGERYRVNTHYWPGMEIPEPFASIFF